MSTNERTNEKKNTRWQYQEITNAVIWAMCQNERVITIFSSSFISLSWYAIMESNIQHFSNTLKCDWTSLFHFNAYILLSFIFLLRFLFRFWTRSDQCQVRMLLLLFWIPFCFWGCGQISLLYQFWLAPPESVTKNVIRTTVIFCVWNIVQAERTNGSITQHKNKRTNKNRKHKIVSRRIQEIGQISNRKQNIAPHCIQFYYTHNIYM